MKPADVTEVVYGVLAWADGDTVHVRNIWKICEENATSSDVAELRATVIALSAYLVGQGVMVPGRSEHIHGRYGFDVWSGSKTDWVMRMAAACKDLNEAPDYGLYELTLTPTGKDLIGKLW